MAQEVAREQLADGQVRLSTPKCAFTFTTIAKGILHVGISGHDTGAFGPAVFEEIRFHVSGPASLELFVDATKATGPTSNVSEAWTRFLSTEAKHLKRVTILAVSKFVHLTVSVAKLFSRTGELIQVYSNPALFKAAMERATSRKA
jgi:hypothetical protein